MVTEEKEFIKWSDVVEEVRSYTHGTNMRSYKHAMNIMRSIESIGTPPAIITEFSILVKEYDPYSSLIKACLNCGYQITAI